MGDVGDDFTREDVESWFTSTLGRPPEVADVYLKAKDYFELGYFKKALLCLEYYRSMPGALLPGIHLLGYCYMNLDMKTDALREFRKCVNHGFDDDWQLIVELQVELEGDRARVRGELELDLGGPAGRPSSPSDTNASYTMSSYASEKFNAGEYVPPHEVVLPASMPISSLLQPVE